MFTHVLQKCHNNKSQSSCYLFYQSERRNIISDSEFRVNFTYEPALEI